MKRKDKETLIYLAKVNPAWRKENMAEIKKNASEYFSKIACKATVSYIAGGCTICSRKDKDSFSYKECIVGNVRKKKYISCCCAEAFVKIVNDLNKIDKLEIGVALM